MVAHAYEVIPTVRVDGELDAVVVKITDTGDSSVAAGDRYKHTVNHNLGRVPVGCMVQMSDGFTRVKVVSADSQKITVQFEAARLYVHLRIW